MSSGWQDRNVSWTATGLKCPVDEKTATSCEPQLDWKVQWKWDRFLDMNVQFETETSMACNDCNDPNGGSATKNLSRVCDMSVWMLLCCLPACWHECHLMDVEVVFWAIHDGLFGHPLIDAEGGVLTGHKVVLRSDGQDQMWHRSMIGGLIMMHQHWEVDVKHASGWITWCAWCVHNGSFEKGWMCDRKALRSVLCVELVDVIISVTNESSTSNH